MRYDAIRTWLAAHPALVGLARRGVRFVPDVPVTRTIPQIGPFRFGIRRHRWLLGENCLAGHQRNLEMFRRLIRPGDVVYDVGANIGYYARYMLGNLPLSRLVAFEPMTANLRLLRRNIALGQCGDRATVLPLALGDADAEELLQIDDIAGGSSVLDTVSGGQPAEGRLRLGLGAKTEPVRVRRLDTAIHEHGLPPPRFIKIDTEGAEAMVIRGALATLRAHRPRLLIATHGPDCLRDTVRELTAIGYACYGATTEAEQRRWIKLRVDAENPAVDNNIVCAAEGDGFEGMLGDA
jgi:FkbM family methyltransferase